MSRTHGSEHIGCLSDPLSQLAARVIEIIAAQASMVWVDDRSEVFVAAIDSPQAIPSHWLVGSYTCGMSTPDIEDDLRAVLAERARNWIIS